MSDVRLILCTFPDLGQARQIGTAMVERQLAACVNILPALESIYRWQGNVETASEVLAIFKTTADAYFKLEKALADLHPYEVPEIIALDPEQVSGPYLEWVHGQVVS